MNLLPTNPHMFKQNAPYRSRTSKLAEQLIKNGSSSAPVQHPVEGFSRLVQALVGGAMQGRDDRQREEANALLLKGLTAKQWDIPEGEIVLSNKTPDEFSPGYDGYETSAISHAEARSREPRAGGLAGALTALQAETKNPHAQRLAQQFAIQDILRKQAREDKAIDRDNQFTYQRVLKAAPGWQAPKAPVPGRDVPYPEGVFNQRKALGRAGANKSFGPPPAGYMYQETPNGLTMVPIPGSPAATKAEAVQTQAAGRKETQERYSNIVLEDIGRVREKIKGAPWYSPTTGFAGDMAKNLGGSRAHDVSGMLDTIKANVGFDRLQEMRNNSPTGGALGQVSEQENKLLQATLGSVMQSQSEDQLVRNLDRLENIYLDIIHGKGNRPEVDSARRAPNSVGNGIPINSPRPGGAVLSDGTDLSKLSDEELLRRRGLPQGGATVSRLKANMAYGSALNASAFWEAIQSFTSKSFDDVVLSLRLIANGASAKVTFPRHWEIRTSLGICSRIGGDSR